MKLKDKLGIPQIDFRPRISDWQLPPPKLEMYEEQSWIVAFLLDAGLSVNNFFFHESTSNTSFGEGVWCRMKDYELEEPPTNEVPLVLASTRKYQLVQLLVQVGQSVWF